MIVTIKSYLDAQDLGKALVLLANPTVKTRMVFMPYPTGGTTPGVLISKGYGGETAVATYYFDNQGNLGAYCGRIKWDPVAQQPEKPRISQGNLLTNANIWPQAGELPGKTGSHRHIHEQNRKWEAEVHRWERAFEEQGRKPRGLDPSVWATETIQTWSGKFCKNCLIAIALMDGEVAFQLEDKKLIDRETGEILGGRRANGKTMASEVATGAFFQYADMHAIRQWPIPGGKAVWRNMTDEEKAGWQQILESKLLELPIIE